MPQVTDPPFDFWGCLEEGKPSGAEHAIQVVQY